MQPPPPFEMPGGAPKKKSPWPWIIVGGVLLCCVGPIVVGGGGLFFAAKQGIPVAECGIMFSSIGKSMERYVADHDGKLPDAKTWQTDIAKYYDAVTPKSGETGPISIPSSKEALGCGSSPKTAVVFNEAFSGKVLASIKDRESIIVFETNETAAINKSGAYKDPGKAVSPKVCGNNRGWFAINAALNDIVVVDGKQGTADFSSGRRSR